MFEELDKMFPGHGHFYEVAGFTVNEALERCARLTVDGDDYVTQVNGKIIFVSKTKLDVNGIPWLNPVAGTPVDVDASPVNPE